MIVLVIAAVMASFFWYGSPRHKVDSVSSTILKKGNTNSMSQASNKINTGESLTLNSTDSVTVGEITIKSTPMGHKITTNGSKSLAQLNFKIGSKPGQQIVYEGDSFNFEHYNIKVLTMGTDGENVTLILKDTRVAQPHSETNRIQSLEIKNGDTATVFDLTIMSKSGGHEIVENGEDPSWVNLELSTPRKSKVLHTNQFANESGSPDSDINFDNYIVRVENVGFNADVIKLTVTKK